MSIIFLILAITMVAVVTALAVSGAAGRTRLILGSAAAIILLAGGNYIMLGRPDMTRPKAATVEVLRARAIAKLDETYAILARSSNASVDNWTELASQYLSLEAPAKAAEALGTAVRIAPDPDQREALLGGQAQALVNANDRRVGPKARAIFEDILSRNPDDLRALFFLGLAAENSGDKTATQTYWGQIIRIAPEDAPWRKSLQERLERVGAETSVSPPETLKLEAGAEQKMIEGMVARLANRLATKGGSAQQWAQLGKAYAVLGRNAEAVKAYDQALILTPEDETLKRARQAVSQNIQ